MRCEAQAAYRSWCSPQRAAPEEPLLSLSGDLGAVPLSGALSVGVVAARGVLPVHLVVPAFGRPSHRSFSAKKHQACNFQKVFSANKHFVLLVCISPLYGSYYALGESSLGTGKEKNGYFQVCPAYCSPDLR